MLVRFFAHGKVKKGATTRTGGGGDVRSYLLFDRQDRSKPRENARLIYGDDVATTEVINGIKNSKIYTSGVLSFAEEESITESQKIEIIESFEKNLFPGMTAGEYSGYWVEHLDKGRQELHFVYADIHLPTGRALPVFYHIRDLSLVDSWKDLINFDYGLEDPNDPKRKQAFRLKGYEYALKKEDEQALKDNPETVVRKFDEEEIGKWLIEEIIDNETIQTQDDVLALLSETFEVTRVAKDGKSISIKNPAGGRNIKLKGMMYEREFSRERFELSGKTQTTEVVKRAELVERNRIEVDRRIQRLENRFSEYYRTIRELAQDVEFTPDGASRGYGNDAYRGGEPTPGQVGGESRASQDAVNEHDRAAESVATSGSKPHRAGDDGPNPEPGGDSQLRRGSTATSPGEYEPERESLSDVLSGLEQKTSQYASEGNHSGASDFLFSDDTNSGNGRDGVLFKTPDDGPTSTAGSSTASGVSRRAESGNDYDQGTANTARGKGVEHDNGVAKRPKSKTAVDYSQESTSGRVWAESQGAKGTIGGSRDAHENPTEQVTQSNPQGIYHDRSYQSESAHHTKLRDVVEGFITEARDPSQREPKATAASDQSGSYQIDTDVIRTVIADYQAGGEQTEPDHAHAGSDLLERIRKHQQTAVRNAEIRQGRVSTLTKQNEKHVDRVGPIITTRRRGGKKFIERVAEIDNQLTDTNDSFAGITAVYEQGTSGIGRINRRFKKLKVGYDHDAKQFKTTTREFGGVVGAICSLVKGIIELFKKLFDGLKQRAMTYADQGLLVIKEKDDSVERKATTAEAKFYINSHPYDLSGYARLELTVQNWDKQKKENDNKPKFQSFGR